MERPMIEVAIPPAPSQAMRGRSAASPLLSGNEQDDESVVSDDNIPDATTTVARLQTTKFSGHPCAAGCGHLCWAATRISGGNDS
jgi:WD repeat-containing protein 24